MTILHDIRYAVRAWRHAPMTAVLAVSVLAVAIGAATAILSVAATLLLAPLPYRDAGRLVVALHGPEATAPVSPADYLDYKAAATTLDLAAAQAWSATIDGGPRPVRLNALRVSGTLFELLGVPAALGRVITPADESAGADVIVLSHGLWTRHFAADPSVVGRTLHANGRAMTVVGVMPPDFRFAPFWQTGAELWAPLDLSTRRTDRAGRSLRVFGRLHDDVGVGTAQSEMTAIAAGLARAYPDTNTGVTITVRPLLDKVVAGVRPTFVVLAAMVGLLLLLGCANVANALLARASGRTRELAVRAALGAPPGRIVAPLLAESLLVACAGAALGVLLAGAAIRLLRETLPAGSLPRQAEIGANAGMFWIACAAALGATVLTALLPARHALRLRLSALLGDGSRGSTGHAGRRVRSILIAFELAIALVLVTGAAIMGRAMLRLTAIDPGFRVANVVETTVSLAGTADAAPERRTVAFDAVLARLTSFPGIQAAGAINHLPLAGDTWRLGYSIDGRPAPPADQRPGAIYRVVLPGYFDAMSLPLREGRAFSEIDRPGAPAVAIVNRTLALREWPGESAVGRTIRIPGPGNADVPLTIVGVAADARQGDWTSAPDSEVYLPYAQRAGEFGLDAMTFVARTTGDPRAVAATLAPAIAAVLPSAAVATPTTMARVVGDTLWRERLTTALATAFGIVSLLLAAAGVYAVVGYSVARREREFGVRLALGASPARIVASALGDVLRPVVVGCASGVVLAALGGEWMASRLAEVTRIDAVSLVIATVMLVASAFAAAWLPARRALRVDPIVALRSE